MVVPAPHRGHRPMRRLPIHMLPLGWRYVGRHILRFRAIHVTNEQHAVGKLGSGLRDCRFDIASSSAIVNLCIAASDCCIALVGRFLPRLRPLLERPFFCQIASASASLYRRAVLLAFGIDRYHEVGEIRPTNCPFGRNTTISPDAGKMSVSAVTLT